MDPGPHGGRVVDARASRSRADVPLASGRLAAGVRALRGRVPPRRAYGDRPAARRRHGDRTQSRRGAARDGRQARGRLARARSVRDRSRPRARAASRGRALARARARRLARWERLRPPRPRRRARASPRSKVPSTPCSSIRSPAREPELWTSRSFARSRAGWRPRASSTYSVALRARGPRRLRAPRARAPVWGPRPGDAREPGCAASYLRRTHGKAHREARRDSSCAPRLRADP
jgi:hypothetical protein